MEREDPSEDEESRRALLLPVSECSSLARLFRLPDSSASTAITDLKIDQNYHSTC